MLSTSPENGKSQQTQQNLFHKTAPTSRESFSKVKPQLPGRALKALKFIVERGKEGATDQELADHFGWVYHGVAAVTGRTLHRQHGLIVDSGNTRPNRSGHQARVWIAKQSEAT